MSRTLLGKALKLAFLRSEKSGKPFAVILFSIDRFRLLNHRFGYTLANRTLKRVCDVARATVGRAGIVGRWGNDEFLCILSDCTDRNAKALARALDAAIRGLAIPAEQNVITVTASFGIACSTGSQSVQDVMNTADETLYEAKRKGRNRILGAESLGRRIFQMGGLLEAALREDRVVPAYQPIVDLASGAIVAEEALARIVTVEGQILGADQFIEAAGQFHLTYKIDWTVLLSALNRREAHNTDIVHFVNISGDLLGHPQLLRELLTSTKNRFPDSSNAHVKPLVIEVTERELLDDMDTARERLAPFIDFGVQLALDDFGSGYSSFQYLADLPISFLKLDGRLISRIAEPKVLSIVRGIQAVAADLGIITLAEYVEREQQVDLLRRVGVNWAQGHYFGPAIIDQSVADRRRAMSVNWAQGYYYQKEPSPQTP